MEEGYGVVTDDDLLPKPPSRAWTDPVKVVVVYDDGTQEMAYLTELDLCAQVNHGC